MRKCGMIVNETTLQQTQNDVEVVHYMSLYGLQRLKNPCNIIQAGNSRADFCKIKRLIILDSYIKF